jgi:hypothetical protein
MFRNHVKHTLLIGLTSLAMMTALVSTTFLSQSPAQAAGSSGPQATFSRLTSLGTTSLATSNTGGVLGPLSDEFAPEADNDSSDSGSGGDGLGGPAVTPQLVAGQADGVSGFNGLNFFNTRFADGGNAFSVEPPDGGFCAGNGFVVEALNDVTAVYSASSHQMLKGPTSLNTFFNYPFAINRTTGVRGPELTDPTCLFDAGVQRWFLTVLTLDTTPRGALIGTNHIDFAVSQTADPTGSWNIYSFHTEDDGTLGQPNHHCAGGPCFGDFPHIGADANGFYVTTNEFSLFGAGSTTAQIYAISKRALAAGAANPLVVHLDNLQVNGANEPGFSLAPSKVPGTHYAETLGGTQYFLSALAAPDNRLDIWALTNTRSLDSDQPNLKLVNGLVTAEAFQRAARSSQKPGSVPLADCVNINCLGLGHDPNTEVEGQLDSGDTRINQLVFANGKLWSSLDTAVMVNGQVQAGLAFFVISPKLFSTEQVGGEVLRQGYVSVANNNVTYGALGVTDSGKGVLTFTLVGQDHFPSSAFVFVDVGHGASDIHVAAEGVGPQDGFTEYPFVSGQNRPRWGDYSGAVAVGGTIWLETEYIAQTCTLSQFQADPTCGGTRGPLGNWGTFITAVQVGGNN